MNFLTAYLTISVLVSFFVSTYALQSKARGSKAFAITCLLGTFWTLAELIKRTWPDYEAQFIVENLRFLFVIYVPPSIFIFAIQYCRKKITKKHIFLILLIPMISTLVLATNEMHSLLFRGKYFDQEGILKFQFNHYYWWIHLPYSYGILSSTLSVIASSMKDTSKQDRKKLLILLISISIPFIFDSYRLFSGNTLPTVISFPIFSSITAFAVLRYDFLRSNPVAYEKVFLNMQDGVIVTNNKNIILDANPATSKILGKPPEEIIGKTLGEGFSEIKELAEKHECHISSRNEFSINNKGKKKYISFTIIPIEEASFEGKVFILRDITDHKNYESFLENLAFRDPLTNVANRRKLQEEFEIFTLQSRKNFALVYFDLNDFKKINDSFGHETGDELLKLVVARANSVLREKDVLGRIGGDEFAVLLHDCDYERAQAVAERITEAISRPFIVKGFPLNSGISLGIAIYPEDGKTFGEVLREADKRLIINKKIRKQRKKESYR